VCAGIEGKCPHATHTTPSPTRLLTRAHGHTLPHTGLSWASSWARAGLGRCVDREREGAPTARKPSPGADLSSRLGEERRSVGLGRAMAARPPDHGQTTVLRRRGHRPSRGRPRHGWPDTDGPRPIPPSPRHHTRPHVRPHRSSPTSPLPTHSPHSRSASPRTAPPAPSSPARPSPRPWTCPICRPPARPPTSPTSSAKWGSSKSCGALST